MTEDGTNTHAQRNEGSSTIEQQVTIGAVSGSARVKIVGQEVVVCPTAPTDET